MNNIIKVLEGYEDDLMAGRKKKVCEYTDNLVIPFLKEAVTYGYQAKSDESVWTDINDVPDDWKDGETEVDLIVGGERVTECEYEPNIGNGFWIHPQSGYKVTPTHAMLPPVLPKALK